MKLKFDFLGILIIFAMMFSACGSKKENTLQTAGQNESVKAGETSSDRLSFEENDLKALAKRGFDLIIQLEGRDYNDPHAAEELGKLGEMVEKLSFADQTIYNEELRRLYTGSAADGAGGSLLPVIQIGRAASQNLNKFNSFHEFNDRNNRGERIVIWTDIAVKRFDYISTRYDYESNFFVVDDILYTINDWQPERAFLAANSYMGDGVPTRGISFLDGKNIIRYFYISESETDGSLALYDF